MSFGNPIWPVRMTPDLVREIRAAIQAANTDRNDAPYTTSEWIRQACKEKLAKGRRGRAQRLHGIPPWSLDTRVELT